MFTFAHSDAGWTPFEGDKPYTQEFLSRYRAAQIARNRRITAWVKEKLATLPEQGRPDDEFGSVSTARWPIHPGLTRRSIPTIAPPARVPWAILRW